MKAAADVNEKLDALVDSLRGMKSAVLAYSGGLDSTLLLEALRLSGIRALAVTSKSPATPRHDLQDALLFAGESGVEHRVVQTPEMENEGFVKNTPDRCFHCKDVLFGVLKDIAMKEGYAFVLDGTNLDDLGDHRPGIDAAKKHGVKSPLLDAGFTKQGIREAARSLGLAVWDKPSSACLSSRIPYGTPISKEALSRVSGAENTLRQMGFTALRVRHHGEVARVEVPEADWPSVMEKKDKIVSAIKEQGFSFVCLDLEGLKSGSMNRLIK